jgi:hypothetical protein
LYHSILELKERSGEGQMTIDVTGGACINPIAETVYTFLVIKEEEKKNIEITRYTRADYSPCGPDCASSMCLPKSWRKILTVCYHISPQN